jgi:hypothetical protein
MALPDDGRTDLADLVTIGNAVSALISPALQNAAIGFNLVYSELAPANTNVIKFRKSGSLIAEAVSEGAVYVPSDANSDMNDTSTTVTASKVAVASPITVESMRFGAGAADVPRIADEQGRAIARKFDTDLFALFNSVTNVATATNTLDTDTLLNGQYQVYNSKVPPGPLAAILDYKGAFEIKKLVSNSGAAQYSNQQQIGILNGVPQANNFIGNFLGIDIYQTSGLSTTGGDDQGLIFDPRYAFAAALGGSIESRVDWSGMGVTSQVAGFSWIVQSYIFYGVALWNDTAACELRSDT